MSLEALGISKEILIFGVIVLSIILLLTFLFIFLGINAFALGGSFGAVINSILAMGNSLFNLIYIIYVFIKIITI